VTIVSYAVSVEQVQAGAGELALCLLISLLVAGGAHVVGWNAFRNHFLAAMVTGTAFLGSFALQISVMNNFQIFA
jgi:hypothetical protein